MEGHIQSSEKFNVFLISWKCCFSTVLIEENLAGKFYLLLFEVIVNLLITKNLKNQVGVAGNILQEKLFNFQGDEASPPYFLPVKLSL